MTGPVPCTAEELPQLRELLSEVFRRGIGREGDLFLEYPTVYTEENLGNLLVIRDGGRIVSHVGIKQQRIRLGREALETGMISGVATLEGYRGRGLASKLMDEAEDKIVRDGMEVGVLWSHFPDFYRRLGWEYAGRMGRLDIDRPERTEIGVEVRPYAGEAEELGRIHRRAGINEVLRRPQDEHPLYGCWSWRTLVARDAGEVAGYAVVYGAGESLGLNEIDGSPTAVVGLVNYLFEREDAQAQCYSCSPVSPSRRVIESAFPTQYHEVNSGIWKILNREEFYRKVESALGLPRGASPAAEFSDPRLESQWVFGSCLRDDSPPTDVPANEDLPLEIHISFTDHV